MEKTSGNVRVPVVMEHIPVFVKAGSVLPLSEACQYSGEVANKPWEINIYPGADGKFEVYEDEGINYEYEKGKYATFTIEWKDKQNKVILHGHVDDKTKLLQMIRSSQLFFFPSLSEGSPRVVIEAMSQGIPVVSTPVGSLPTTFEDKKEIRFFDFNDYEMAYDIIKSFLSERSSFEKMRDEAYKKVKNNYTIEAFLGKIFEC